MSYYIMYEDDNDYEMTVVKHETSREVSEFIEDKINKHAHKLEDFKVVQGTELHVRAVRTAVKILLTN